LEFSKPFSTVSLVAPFQPVPFDEEFILFSKTSLSVMFFLASNIVGNFAYIGMRDRESSVSFTPGEPAFDQTVLIDPM